MIKKIRSILKEAKKEPAELSKFDNLAKATRLSKPAIYSIINGGDTKTANAVEVLKYYNFEISLKKT